MLRNDADAYMSRLGYLWYINEYNCNRLVPDNKRAKYRTKATWEFSRYFGHFKCHFIK